MIKTQDEYINACDFIDSDMELYDFKITKKMSSYEYNLYLQDTEYFLNLLYEKIRVLEDLCDYLEQYAETKISNTKQKININAGLLNKALTIYEDDKTTVVAPEWNRDLSTHLMDRDGSVLPVAESTGTELLSASCKTNLIQQVTIKKNNITDAYSNIVSTTQDSYFVSYQHTAYIPVEEIVHVILPADAEYNHVDIEPVNCTLTLTKQDNDILVVMHPNGYDKELRNFNFVQAGSSLDTIVLQEREYDANKTIQQNKQDDLNKQQKQDNINYMHDILLYQDTVLQNNEKSKAVGGSK